MFCYLYYKINISISIWALLKYIVNKIWPEFWWKGAKILKDQTYVDFPMQNKRVKITHFTDDLFEKCMICLLGYRPTVAKNCHPLFGYSFFLKMPSSRMCCVWLHLSLLYFIFSIFSYYDKSLPVRPIHWTGVCRLDHFDGLQRGRSRGR